MPYTDKQIDELRHDLERRRTHLLEEIRTALARSGEQHYIDLAGQVADAGEASVADLLVDVDTAMSVRDIRELRDVEAALERIAAGDYGECSDCGGDIGFPRLKAYPTAARCILCQTKFEKSHAGEGTPSL
ncbi:MAG: TraR/DksA family transcriptional regulator [Burkholderiales bacterium]|nr:TraR/DksA family transcriptional regulator [Burkholderiales bacterium]